MMGTDAIIARRYAQAFLNLYGAQLTTHDFMLLQQARHFFDTYVWYLSLLKIPVLDQDKKERAVEHILIDRFSLPRIFKKLVQLLAQDRRLSLIAEIINQICSLYLVGTDTHAFTVYSSTDLTQEEKKDVESFLAQQVKHVIIKEYKKDVGLIAGLRMQSDTRLWEHSVRKQLASLAAHVGVTRKE